MKVLIPLFIFCLFFLNACNNTKEIKHEGSKPQPTIAKDVELEKWTEILKRETYSIDISKTPNPFMTFKIHKKLVEQEEITPLELVGILQRDEVKIALLQDSFRRGYIVKKGDKLGTSIIRDIGDEHLVIEEIARDEKGRETIRKRTITLKRER